MTSCPALRWFGSVSARLSWAVNPLAAHAATPNEPLPRSIDCLGNAGARPRTMLDRRTRFAVSTLNAPPLHAVVAACAGPPAAAAHISTASRPTDLLIVGLSPLTAFCRGRNYSLVKDASQ